jgi:hypothetical protein
MNWLPGQFYLSLPVALAAFSLAKSGCRPDLADMLKTSQYSSSSIPVYSYDLLSLRPEHPLHEPEVSRVPRGSA